MSKLSATTSFNTKPHRTGRDALSATATGCSYPSGGTWLIKYLFEGVQRKCTIGVLDKAGAAGESISSWLDNGRLSLAQARAIAG